MRFGAFNSAIFLLLWVAVNANKTVSRSNDTAYVNSVKNLIAQLLKDDDFKYGNYQFANSTNMKFTKYGSLIKGNKAVQDHELNSEEEDPVDQLWAELTKMRSFIKGIDFDVARFEISADDLRLRIAYLGFVLEKQIPYNTKSLKILLNVKKMFRAMTGAAGVIRVHDYSETHHSLVRYTAQLNIMFFQLFDEYGIPNPDLPGYLKVVETFNKTTDLWEKIFDYSKNVPFSVYQVFQSQLFIARNTLKVLSMYYEDQNTPVYQPDWSLWSGEHPPSLVAFVLIWQSGFDMRRPLHSWVFAD